MTATAERLVEAATDEQVAAVWIQAALRQCAGRRNTDRELAKLLPLAEWLEDECYKVFPVEYHSWAAQTLPIAVEIPERAVLTVYEFVRLVALTQLATTARLCVGASYVRGYAMPLRSAGVRAA
jgi:hypothetical protein